MRDESGVALLAEVAEDLGEVVGGEGGDEIGGGGGLGGVVAHVEGAFPEEGEAPGGVVDVWGGEAEVGEEAVGGHLEVGEATGEFGEVGVKGDDAGRVGDFVEEALVCMSEVGGIGVVEDERAGWAEATCDEDGVPGESGGGVDEGLA